MLLFLALLMPVMAAVFAVVISIGMVMAAKSDLQGAAESGALAAAQSALDGEAPEAAADVFFAANLPAPVERELALAAREQTFVMVPALAAELAAARQALEEERLREVVYGGATPAVERAPADAAAAWQDWQAVQRLLAERSLPAVEPAAPPAADAVAPLPADAVPSAAGAAAGGAMPTAQMVALRVRREVPLFLLQMFLDDDLATVGVEAAARALAGVDLVKGEPLREKAPALPRQVPAAAPFAVSLPQSGALTFDVAGRSPQCQIVVAEEAEEGWAAVPIVYRMADAGRFAAREEIVRQLKKGGKFPQLDDLGELLTPWEGLPPNAAEIFFTGWGRLAAQDLPPVEPSLQAAPSRESPAALSAPQRDAKWPKGGQLPKEPPMEEGTLQDGADALKDAGEDAVLRESLMADVAGGLMASLAPYLVPEAALGTLQDGDERLLLVPLLYLPPAARQELAAGENLFSAATALFRDPEDQPLPSYSVFCLTAMERLDREADGRDGVVLQGYFLRGAVPAGTAAHYAATRRQPSGFINEKTEERPIPGSEFRLALRARLIE